MPRRKERLAVVFDTNVLIGFYLSRHPQSANRRVFRLWRDERKLQLIVSREMLSEYLEVLARVGVAEPHIELLAERFDRRRTITHVKLGARPLASRDPDDNLVLATASVGKAKFLVTNDRDLLDIPTTERKRFKFEIVTPTELLEGLEI